MPSTFFGLTIASSAVNAFQAAINTTGNNISNVQTKGYSKQVANRQASQGLRVYQKFGTTGSGVTTTSITALRNSYYDTKYWENQSSVGRFQTKMNYLKQIESYFIDDGAANPGFNTLFDDMFNQLNAFASDDEDENRRKNFISSAKIFTSYFNNVGNGLSRLQKDCNNEIKTLVDSINSSAEKIAALTKQINSIELQQNGMIANELRDQRALIIDELSEIVPVTVEESPVTNSNYPDMYVGGTNYIVKIDGQTLVNTFEYRKLNCVPREDKINQTDVEGLYDVVWGDTGMKFNMNAKSMDGSLKALLEIRDGNNGENFQGQVVNAGVSTIKIRPTTMTTIESMTMAEEGVITIRNKEYHYSGFEVELGEDGKIALYTFQLDMSSSAGDLIGMQAKIGNSIDVMGIPYYMGQMSEFIRSFSERFNAYQHGGADLNGNPMGSFFIANKYDGSEYDFADQSVNTDGVTDPAATTISSVSNSYYQMTALNFCVAEASLRDSAIFATTTADQIAQGNYDAHDITDAMQALKSDVRLFRGGSAEAFLECIYSDISIDSRESDIFLDNFTDISNAITNQRLSISGVDEDEEALDLVKFQNAYNLAARMIQCMSELYDKLINGTGI